MSVPTPDEIVRQKDRAEQAEAEQKRLLVALSGTVAQVEQHRKRAERAEAKLAELQRENERLHKNIDINLELLEKAELRAKEAEDRLIFREEETDQLIKAAERQRDEAQRGLRDRARLLAAAEKERDDARVEVANLEGEARVLIGCPCRCHISMWGEPHQDCRECVRGSHLMEPTTERMDADHDWALWHEKWIAALDLMGSQAERAEQAEAALAAERACHDCREYRQLMEAKLAESERDRSADREAYQLLEEDTRLLRSERDALRAEVERLREAVSEEAADAYLTRLGWSLEWDGRDTTRTAVVSVLRTFARDVLRRAALAIRQQEEPQHRCGLASGERNSFKAVGCPACEPKPPDEKCPYCGLMTCRYGLDPKSECHSKGDSCRCPTP